ncbi:hypothetical protein SERLA73DRAFT_75656 [Serpula lacrymans var. lacrymans S7.3]|uniref:Uncharacterized protein n=1 Tax=Serpula lacrymans var. lacrymans (strain S7.3) TaxID=936435 RepID=F8Q3U2_SERL3|nr:hypothetical protein SERLA73DRAFT_75656 [Serpula lacrymans var. lacrymans S7.3]
MLLPSDNRGDARDDKNQMWFFVAKNSFAYCEHVQVDAIEISSSSEAYVIPGPSLRMVPGIHTLP